MVLRILCIGDVGNIIKTISRFSESDIHIINWPKTDAGIYTYDDVSHKNILYLYIYMYIYVHIYIYIYTCMCIFTYLKPPARGRRSVGAYINTHI